MQYLLGGLREYPYLFMFAGLLVAGEVVLLPGLYLAVTGRLDFAMVIGVAITATMLSDLAWYGSGRLFPDAMLQRLSRRRAGRMLPKMDRMISERGPQLLILSKFVYGTRTLAQVLAGVHRMPVPVYLAANALGVTSITLLLSGLAWIVATVAVGPWSR